MKIGITTGALFALLVSVAPQGAYLTARANSLPAGAAATGYNQVTDVGSMYSTTVMTGARNLWSRGITGRGVDVAVIDSGIAAVQGLNGNGKVIYGPDLSFDSPAPNLYNRDGYGHGTHMAGIIAGQDVAETPAAYANDTTNFLGMAPDARLVSVRAADSTGVTDVTQLIAALDWVAQHHADPGLNIRVVNLSYTTDSTQSYLVDPLAHAAENLWRVAHVLVVASSGNHGVLSVQVGDPAQDPYILGVGAADTMGTLGTADDTVAGFSSCGDGVRGPDLVAPGVHLQSLRVPGSQVDQAFGATGRINSRFFRGSGTSQAAAVVSGAAALLFQEYPSATPDQVKQMLTAHARPMSHQLLGLCAGHGELDAARAGAARLTPAHQAWIGSTGLGSVALSRVTRSGSTWSGNTWTGGTWSGGTWSGGTWSGSTWSEHSWS
ncbi:MAG: S8 family serine peptidase [Candidatus Dormibacteria bacterium]